MGGKPRGGGGAAAGGLRRFWQEELWEFQAGAETLANDANHLTGRSHQEHWEPQVELPENEPTCSSEQLLSDTSS